MPLGETTDLTFYTVATNRYLEFWLKLLDSYEPAPGSTLTTRFVVFTNNEEGFNAALERPKKRNVTLSAVFTSNLKWPEATLFRYQLISANSSLFPSRYSFHIDADMEFSKDFSNVGIKKLLSLDRFAVVAHPGFWRPLDIKRRYLANGKLLFSDVRLFLRQGGLGTWSSDNKSAAFTARNKRKTYVAGGFWGGPAEVFSSAVAKLKLWTDIDLKKHIVPIWHDESYLNRYAAENLVDLLGPEYCWTELAPLLDETNYLIRAVTKDSTWDK